MQIVRLGGAGNATFLRTQPAQLKVFHSVVCLVSPLILAYTPRLLFRRFPAVPRYFQPALPVFLERKMKAACRHYLSSPPT